jgi:glutamate/tyrosine decarboxylase-like PLP-dependent enzyme
MSSPPFNLLGVGLSVFIELTFLQTNPLINQTSLPVYLKSALTKFKKTLMYKWLDHDKANIKTLLESVVATAESHFSSQQSKAPSKKSLPLLENTLPLKGLGAAQALAYFNDHIAVELENSSGPRYFGFVTGGSTPASLVGDWLVSTFDNNLSHSSGGIGGQIERQTIQFLKNLFGLEDKFSGVFVSGATMANFVGLATARQWAGEQMGVDISEEGLQAAPPFSVVSAAPHSSILKSMAMLGIGRASLIKIDTLPNREAIDIDKLEIFLQNINQPVIVVANAGTVNTVDFDDLDKIGQLKSRYPFWLHVDAAFGGFAACSATYAHLVNGLNYADSITIDAHKWLNVPYDSAMLFTKHPSIQHNVFQNQAPYLSDAALSPDFLHYTPENSRRFRALPAWFTLIAYGKDGYQEIVERTCSLAKKLGEKINNSESFKLLAPVKMNVVCFTLNTPNLSTNTVQTYLTALHSQNKVFMTPTNYKGIPAIRIAISNWQTTEQDAEITWEALKLALEK